MENEKKKDLATTVVLASHGNKSAMRELYINYNKTVFLVCNLLTDDLSNALECTVNSFVKMFASLSKLENHNDFERWFFTVVINTCIPFQSKKVSSMAQAELLSLAGSAGVFAKNGDTQSFEKTVMQIIEKSISCLPSEARTVYFYKNLAFFGANEIAALQKITQEEALTRLAALDIILSEQNKKIKEYGVDISPFSADIGKTLHHIASKKTVPPSVHIEVAKAVGFDTSPLKAEDEAPKKKKEAPKKKKIDEKSKTKIGKREIILLFAIIALVLGVCAFGGAILMRNSSEQPSQSQQQSEKPALLWNGAASSDFDGGSGTKEDPYQIATGGQLAYLANLVNDGNSFYAACHYILTADIVLNETDSFAKWENSPPENKWTPIGGGEKENSAYFTGVFDGNDHTVSGMYVKTTADYAGLFGICRNSQIKNITLKNCYVEGGSYTGGIAGYFAADASSNSGFSYCGFAGEVKSSGNNAGGITGYFRAEGENNITEIMFCFSSGSVSAEKGYAGGITGANEADTGSAFIKNCYSNALVNAEKNAGGIAGDTRAADGIASAEYSYFAGKAKANENAGGISGFANCTSGTGKVHIANCYMLSTACDTGVIKGEGGEKLVTDGIYILNDAEMQSTESFKDFNFEEIWAVSEDENYKYPVLRFVEFAYLSTEAFSDEASI